MAKVKNSVAVMVTTELKGVFFGYAQPGDFTRKDIRLENARMAVYWSADVKGVLGLASTGPSKDCKIGPRVPAITLHGVTAVTEVTSEAAQQWETAPWR